MRAFVVLVALAAPLLCLGACPYGGGRMSDSMRSQMIDAHSFLRHKQAEVTFEFGTNRASELNWDDVKADVVKMFTDSKDFWPADNGHYGPLMIRHAWHCAGSYRKYDGAGGCDGGRQRFNPELSWQDNTNLDKARRLLEPIKLKYGDALSWGDLIIFTGTVAIENMGGPSLGFCAGRIDDRDGTDSLWLGPTAEQQAEYPCAVDGDCHSPLGATTLGLIYVNPEGPMAKPIPEQSAPQVRDTFDRMGMDDFETVALIGGGHAFGKTHGACPAGAGPDPLHQPWDPWPGLCGNGKGEWTYTSGFEGSWSPTPTKWSNQYFLQLLGNDWKVDKGVGDHWQWKTNGSDLMMLTADISLLNDPQNIYQGLVDEFAANETLLADAFGKAWYKLVTRDMGPVTRCVGPYVPPAQDFQYPLPPAPKEQVEWSALHKSISAAMTTRSAAIDPDGTGENPTYAYLFVELAYQCAATYRQSDYLGGCNGARIRFPPQSQWNNSVALDRVIEVLSSVKDEFGAKLSWADLIVAAGQVAIQTTSEDSVDLDWCGGRTDATDGKGSAYLQPTLSGNATFGDIRLRAGLMGFDSYEMVALFGRPRSPSQMIRLGYSGSWTTSALPALSNEYFVALLTNDWTKSFLPSGLVEYKSGPLVMTLTDMQLLWDPEYKAIVDEFAGNNDRFIAAFTSAWTHLMIADRFDGPNGNLCVNENSAFGRFAPVNSALFAVAAAVAAFLSRSF